MKLPYIAKFTAVAATLLSVVAAHAADATPAGTPSTLAVGATAPVTQGIDQNGKSVNLAEVYKKGITLVYFYPKAGTKGCTDEACSLRDAYADLTKENLTIVGVSHDTVAEQKKFADDNKLQFSLLSDPKGDIYKAFLVPGVANRQSFLIKDGKVAWLDLKASTAQQANDIKKALAALSSSAPAPSAAATAATSK
jgi:peroxiredoxin Q/BCP